MFYHHVKITDINLLRFTVQLRFFVYAPDINPFSLLKGQPRGRMNPSNPFFPLVVSVFRITSILRHKTTLNILRQVQIFLYEGGWYQSLLYFAYYHRVCYSRKGCEFYVCFDMWHLMLSLWWRRDLSTEYLDSKLKIYPFLYGQNVYFSPKRLMGYESKSTLTGFTYTPHFPVVLKGISELKARKWSNKVK